jgi:hypothetical protein
VPLLQGLEVNAAQRAGLDRLDKELAALPPLGIPAEYRRATGRSTMEGLTEQLLHEADVTLVGVIEDGHEFPSETRGAAYAESNEVYLKRMRRVIEEAILDVRSTFETAVDEAGFGSAERGLISNLAGAVETKLREKWASEPIMDRPDREVEVAQG